MQVFRSFSSRFLLGLFVAAPTVFLYTVSDASAQRPPKPILVKPSGSININRTLNSPNPGVARLIQQAKNDPALYNLLIANPSQALANVDYLDPATKAELSKLILKEIKTGKSSQSLAAGCFCTGCCISSMSPGTPTTLPAENFQQQLR